MAQVKIYPIPHTRDPFINTPLIPAGVDPETGEERFFISTWNANVGCISALVDTSGKSRIYHFKKANPIYAGCGAYSAVLTDPDTVWICSDLALPVRLTLSTGEYQFFESGARNGLVFAGMQYDEASGKLLAVSCQYQNIMGLSFDTRTQKTVKLYDNFTEATYSRGGFPNSDGKTYTIRFTTCHSSLYQWDPEAETLTEKCMIDERSNCVKVIYDDEGRAYIPYMGWLDTSDYTFSRGLRPDREMDWFGRIGTNAYGMLEGASDVDIYVWDMTTGKTRVLCTIPDGGDMGVALTKKGEIMAVNVYGMLYKFSAEDGTLLLTRKLDSCAPGRLDCLIRVDDSHILGTPYITQRFWIIDTEKGKGFDAGRAAPGRGEVLRVWNIGDKIYMASYTEGILTEYDPAERINFPENPRIVAHPPTGMRPFAHTDDGICLYYSCNHHYGNYGCVLTRYNTQTGEAFYLDDPLPLQNITSLSYSKKHGFLLGSSTTAADSDCMEPQTDRCYIIRVNPETLEIFSKTETPVGCEFSRIWGRVDDDTYLVSFRMIDKNASFRLYSMEQDCFEDFVLPEGTVLRAGTDYPGLFLLTKDGDLQVWKLGCDSAEQLETLIPMEDAYAVHLTGDSVYLVSPEKVRALDGALKPYI
jgi:hypothetical protein